MPITPNDRVKHLKTKRFEYLAWTALVKVTVACRIVIMADDSVATDVSSLGSTSVGSVTFDVARSAIFFTLYQKGEKEQLHGTT